MILIKTFVVGLEKGFLNSFYSVNFTLLSLALLVKDIYNAFYFNPPLVPLWFLMGSSMLMDPHPSQQHVGLPHEVFRL